MHHLSRAFIVRASLLLFVLVASGACTSQLPTRCAADDLSLASLQWKPNLDQPIRQLDEVLEAQEQQQMMNYTSANVGFAEDAKLYLLFRNELDAAGEADRQALLREQAEWLAERKRATDAAYDEYAGGTLASFAGSKAFIRMTRERIAVLESRRTARSTTAPTASNWPRLAAPGRGRWGATTGRASSPAKRAEDDATGRSAEYSIPRGVVRSVAGNDSIGKHELNWSQPCPVSTSSH